MKIALLGDIALFGKNTIQSSDWRERFEPIKTVLGEYDYVIGNLESPFTLNKRTIGGKSAYLKGNPEDVELLKYLGITHVSLANNHIFDYCSQGLEDTINTLEKNGIEWYGANGKQARISSPDGDVVLLGYCCYSTNAKGMGIVNILDPYKVEQDIDSLRNALPIVSIHWGQEHVHYPNYDHVEVARKLCTKRKMIIHGHHPHVLQGIEQVGDSLVAYSLGNFCFDDVYTPKSNAPLIKLSKDNMESFILDIEIKEGVISTKQYIPFSFEKGQYKKCDDALLKITVWSEFLKEVKGRYIEQRSKDLQEYLNSRKANRDFEWYIKRMNLESVRMILGAKRNMTEYNNTIRNYISK